MLKAGTATLGSQPNNLINAEGVESKTASRSSARFWHPAGVHPLGKRIPEVSAALRPPATLWQPFWLGKRREAWRNSNQAHAIAASDATATWKVARE
jgi:hypothetical protein